MDDNPWDCGSAGCSHTVRKLDTGVHEKRQLRQPNRDMESPTYKIDSDRLRRTANVRKSQLSDLRTFLPTGLRVIFDELVLVGLFFTIGILVDSVIVNFT